MKLEKKGKKKKKKKRSQRKRNFEGVTRRGGDVYYGRGTESQEKGGEVGKRRKWLQQGTRVGGLRLDYVTRVRGK
jgi:hypothetical protein